MADQSTPPTAAVLRAIEARLQRLEQQMAALAPVGKATEGSSEEVQEQTAATLPESPIWPNNAGVGQNDGVSSSQSSLTSTSSNHAGSNAIQAQATRSVMPTATVVMGLTAAAAFVLAAVYFIKLVYDAGWLTPGLQIGLAAVSGIALIAAGVLFARHDRGYAAYLPAVGVVVLYLAVFAAHLHYELIEAPFAVGAVALTTLCAMWLARQFNNSIYILFAVCGVYVTPVLMEYLRASVPDLVIYYTAWSLLFSFAAIHEGRRLGYMLAMLFAIIGFDLAWRLSGAEDWSLAVMYQFAQFLIFAVTTYVYSTRHRSVLSSSEALVHGVGLFYFYFVQYFTLYEHVPELAPWIALASVAVVLVIYRIATTRLSSTQQLQGSAVLASSYTSVVTSHVLYFQLIPSEYFAWAALFAPLAAALLARLFEHPKARTPLYWVSGAILVIGFISAFTGRAFGNQIIPHASLLLFSYAAVLYGAFFWMRRDLRSSKFATLVLYAGHAALLVATLHAFESDFIISVLWGVFALVLLIFAIKRQDSVIGKSSLLIFTASGLKVLLHDLDGSAPLTRILVLVVLSVSLYAGGWLYQKVSVNLREYTGNPAVDQQISKIAQFVEQGLSNDDIAEKFIQAKEVNHAGNESWNASKIDEIRGAFGF